MRIATTRRDKNGLTFILVSMICRKMPSNMIRKIIAPYIF
jgi:hypothetical protein